jgi:hypothetical protein
MKKKLKQEDLRCKRCFLKKVLNFNENFYCLSQLKRLVLNLPEKQECQNVMLKHFLEQTAIVEAVLFGSMTNKNGDS